MMPEMNAFGDFLFEAVIRRIVPTLQVSAFSVRVVTRSGARSARKLRAISEYRQTLDSATHV